MKPARAATALKCRRHVALQDSCEGAPNLRVFFAALQLAQKCASARGSVPRARQTRAGMDAGLALAVAGRLLYREFGHGASTAPSHTARPTQAPRDDLAAAGRILCSEFGHGASSAPSHTARRTQARCEAWSCERLQMTSQLSWRSPAHDARTHPLHGGHSAHGRKPGSTAGPACRPHALLSRVRMYSVA